ncbi:hypothetical protein AGMMS49944_19380 [Spirochaetia bacterium]|nr:hypothetical protein AGMMS49944_19380 [Spirochaetia bacterium]
MAWSKELIALTREIIGVGVSMKSGEGGFGMLTSDNDEEGWVITLYDPESHGYPPKLGTECIRFGSLDALIAGGWVAD